MNFGIKKKILLVLIGVLALTVMLAAGLASYYTNLQNEKSAFAALSRDLLAWQNDLQALTLRIKSSALSVSADPVVLNQLAELLTLEFNVETHTRKHELPDMARTLAYSKAVSLNRLHFALRTGGFSSIAVYTHGKLSHYVSTSETGMMVRRENSFSTWVTGTLDAAGNLDFQSWPAWQEGPFPPLVARTIGDVNQFTVSFVFPSPEFAAIEIAVPLQGVIKEVLSELPVHPSYQLVSDLVVADPARRQSDKSFGQQRATVAVLVFSKRIDHASLEDIAEKTGKLPILISPDGRHHQQLARLDLTPTEFLNEAQLFHLGTSSSIIQQTVTPQQGSFYAALLPWQFEGRTRLILGLMSSRDPTLQNIRQTVTAILIATGLILMFSIGLGAFWVGRFIDPIIALTRAVKEIGLKRRMEGGQPAGRITADELQPIDLKAPDEIGELSSAFNVMIAELRHSIETLEQRVQTRTAELRQQTRYLRTLIDTLPLWVWLKDTKCRYLTTNQANAQACGHTVDEMIGKSDQELWPPELARRHQANDMEVMMSHQRKTVEEPIEDEHGIVWMETFRAPVLDEDGTLLGIVGAARNISERKAAEEAREKALMEAVRLARQRSEFLAQMSHELRTPLNAILGYAQILQRNTQQLTRRQANGLATIYESGQHLLNLINDILDLARVEAGKLSLYPTDINLPLFLRVVTEIIRVKADEKSLLFTYQAAPDLPASVKADDKRLRQVLLNLLGNAVKFTDRGEVILRVQKIASSEPEDSEEAMVRLRFEVQDSGIGMTEEQCSHLFQPFEQVGDVRRREGGTGLGLAISQQLVRLMGSTIQVQSQLSKGSLFWFELELPVVATVAATLPEPQVMIGYQGPRKKILVVDDVPKNRVMLMDALSSLGFEVFEAGDGQECLDLLDSVKPDLIIMDVMMPVMNGWEAASSIRRLPAFARLPIIIVTASATLEDETKAYAAGANAFLPKPIEHDRLLATIGTLLSLQWLYKEPTAERAEEAEGFIAPPQEEIEQLYYLAKLGDMQRICSQADYLKELDSRYASFAQQLRHLAENYQSKAIVTLVERYRTKQEEMRTENPSV